MPAMISQNAVAGIQASCMGVQILDIESRLLNPVLKHEGISREVDENKGTGKMPAMISQNPVAGIRTSSMGVQILDTESRLLNPVLKNEGISREVDENKGT
jgi:hypothetical protein